MGPTKSTDESGNTSERWNGGTPSEVTVETTEDSQKVTIYGGEERDPNHTHDVVSTAADGWTTHDYGRDEKGNETVNTGLHAGNVLSGSEQYD